MPERARDPATTRPSSSTLTCSGLITLSKGLVRSADLHRFDNGHCPAPPNVRRPIPHPLGGHASMSLSTWRSVRRSAAITTVVAAGLLGTGFVGVANAANTNISGSVRTSGGAAVAGVTVAVKVGTQTKNATTAANGTFSISGVQTGAATITLGSAAAPAAGLPQVWQGKNISTSIAANAVLKFSLPATPTV